MHSMLYRVTYFEGRLFIWKERTGTFLIKKYVTNESYGHRFEEEGTVSVPNTGDDSCCVAQVAGETLQALYIIVQNVDGRRRFNFVINVYNVYRENNKWSTHCIGCFQLNESIIDRIHLTQDLMLWYHLDSLSVFSFGTALKVIKRIPFNEQVRKILLLREIYVDVGVFSACSEESILLVVAKTISADKESIVSFYVLVVDTLNNSDSQLLHLPSDYFILRFYSSIISAINIAFVNINNVCSDSASDLIKDVTKLNWSKNSTLVCTEKRQFIVFFNGCIHYICTVPFPDVYQIISFKLNSPLRTSYILQSLKGACAVEKCELRRVLKVCKSWEDSVAVIVGDFINLGSPQLLFISQTDPVEMFDTCVLTNTAINYYPRIVPSVQSTSQNKDAIKGMKKTLLAGQTALSEARRRMKEMRKVIDHTTQILEFAVSKSQSQRKFYDSNLVGILPTTKGPLSLTTIHKEKPTVAINILATWKIVLLDNWILGWSLRNDSDLILSDFHIHFGMWKEIVEYKYRTYKHLMSCQNCQPNLFFDEENNQSLKKGELLSIVVSISLPFFTYDKLEVICTLCWNSSSTTGTDKPFKQQLSSKCDLCVYNALESQEDSFKELSVAQQLMSLRILQDRLSLHFKSEHTDLTQLEKMLTLKLEHYPYILRHLSSKINIFMDSLSPLYGLNFSINDSSPRQSNSVVHYREVKQLLLFFHWLHNSVPEDITISMGSLPVTVIRKLMLSMKEELCFITSFVQQTQSHQVASLPQVGGSKSSLLQHHLKSEPEHILKDTVAISIEEYIQFRLQLLEKEYESDDVIGQLPFFMDTLHTNFVKEL